MVGKEEEGRRIFYYCQLDVLVWKGMFQLPNRRFPSNAYAFLSAEVLHRGSLKSFASKR